MSQRQPLFIEDSDDSANGEREEGPDELGGTFSHIMPSDSWLSHIVSAQSPSSQKGRTKVDFSRLNNDGWKQNLFPRKSLPSTSDELSATNSPIKKESYGTSRLSSRSRFSSGSTPSKTSKHENEDEPQRKKFKVDSMNDDLRSPSQSSFPLREAAIRDGIRRQMQKGPLQETNTSVIHPNSQETQRPSDSTSMSTTNSKMPPPDSDSDSILTQAHKRRLQTRQKLLEPDSDEDELDGLRTTHRRIRSSGNNSQQGGTDRGKSHTIDLSIEKKPPLQSHTTNGRNKGGIEKSEAKDASNLFSSSSEATVSQPQPMQSPKKKSKKPQFERRIASDENESVRSKSSSLTSYDTDAARVAGKSISKRQSKNSRQMPLRLTINGKVVRDNKDATSSDSEDSNSESAATSSVSSDSQSESDDIPLTRALKKVKRSTNIHLGRADRYKGDQGNKANEEGTGESSDEFSSQTSFYEFPIRRSERAIRPQLSYKEVDETHVDLNDGVSARPLLRQSNKGKSHVKKGSVKDVPRSSPFVQIHYSSCQQCLKSLETADSGKLVMCQGCSFAYHPKCCTPKDHGKTFTMIPPGEYVFQCRFCLKDKSSGYSNRCMKCKEVGEGCKPFNAFKPKPAVMKPSKSSEGLSLPVPNGEEAKVEEAEILTNRPINDPIVVLYRCRKCWRAWHTAHLPSLPIAGNDSEPVSEDEFPIDRYLRRGQCSDCRTCPAEIDKLVAWRCMDGQDNKTFQNTSVFMKEYLIKWKRKSYREVSWMPGTWTESMAAAVTKKKFAANSPYPKPKISDSIPVSYITPEIILDVRFKNGKTRKLFKFADAIEELQAFDHIDKVFTKWAGLSYEDATWDYLPRPGKEAASKLEQFRTAYKEYVRSWYIHLPPRPAENAKRARTKPFNPVNDVDFLKGGTLMQYQLDGLNWLLYKWRRQRNCILADEMGLGKTIQVIAFIAVLFERYALWPHLVVAPNSTVSNWKREFQKWAPALRTVVYTSLSSAKELILKHEMFGGHANDLRCHVVIVSYETVCLAPQPLSKIPWETLTVDEGQRLKNDQTQAYAQLTEFKFGYKSLLTGTPLQNDIGELFNLLQFLNPAEIDARALEVEYADMTSEKVAKLHEMLRPLFLRRTKAEVLKHLPPKYEIILPVRMVKLQKTLYKTILSKNAALLRSIAAGDNNQGGKTKAATTLNNILMQLRKTICHPFMYSEEIENRKVPAAQLHQNLVEASGKLELLAILLPKLKEMGRRVLIFSQFLDVLTILQDFLDGLELPHFRIDGGTTSLERQALIDQYNAPNSPVFAFLLSTRAGGVGINLASADTVILYDCDFNPHQDIQALSRAHRIGQNKKVLVFTLMTPNSVEQKILEVGKKKLLLDHIVVETLADAENEHVDVESILQFGAKALFENDSDDRDPKYSSADVDKILEKSLADDEQEIVKITDDQKTGGFSFAKVWTNSDGGQVEDLQEKTEAEGDSLNFWDKVLAERESRIAADRDAAIAASFVRSKRRSAARTQNYSEVQMFGSDDEPTGFTPAKVQAQDTEFQVEELEHMSESDGTVVGDLLSDSMDLAGPNENATLLQNSSLLRPSQSQERIASTSSVYCVVCGYTHPPEYCPVRWERCRLCGQAHYGLDARDCSRLRTSDAIDEVLALLKVSTEDADMVRAATVYLSNRKRRVQSRTQMETQEPPLET